MSRFSTSCVKKDADWKKTSLNAAALQQHYASLLSIGDPSSKKRRRRKKVPANRDDDRPEKDERLTLAQRLGLVEAPRQRLTEEEWNVVQEEARIRGDSDLPCPICKEEFATDDQIILSCSHVFHRTCFESYEKFSGSASCPLCREANYRKKACLHGEVSYRKKCATRIQAFWRGHRARKIFLRMQLDRDPMKKREYYAEKLSKLSDQLICTVEQSSFSLDNFFEQLDQSVAQCRVICMTEIEWNDVKHRARERGEDVCPICMNSLATEKKVVVTNCSHCFHEACLSSFEQLVPRDGPPKCPVCRTFYVSTEMDFQNETVDEH